MNNSDLAISFGCRFSPQFVGHDFNALKKAKVISVDIEKDELAKKGQKIDYPMNHDLKDFIPYFLKFFKKKKLKKFDNWNSNCENFKKNNPIIIPRNYKVEEALSAAESGDMSLVEILLKALEKPYENTSNLKDFQITEKLNKSGYKTYCGT